MNLEKNLVLNKFFLHLVGYKDFDRLREDFNQTPEGFDAVGNSYMLHALLGKEINMPEHDLKRYDEAIKGYEDKLKSNRNETDFSLKYFQYLAILFSEYYFDKLASNKILLLQELNEFAESYCAEANVNAISFEETDLQKLAYWMATGSGKTLLMHINYWQMMKYFSKWENIILITPNVGLSRQHFEEFRLSGIPCKQYNGSEESLKTRKGEVLIIEVTKLTGEKKGEGLSVDVSYFSENNNLVFIDEGHKGQSSEEKTWKKLREALAKEGFIFEYSATFGQVIRKNTGLLLEEYSKAIIFDYSYRYFFSDGYGKDFYSYNSILKDYNEVQTNIVLTAGLLTYYEQLELFEQYRENLREYKIEKPLWIFVGSKVVGKSETKDNIQQTSDVINILIFLDRVLTNITWFQQQIDILLSGESGLIDPKGNDIFRDRFHYVRASVLSAEKILNKIFNGNRSLDLYEIKNAEGEIALRAGNSEQIFGIINIGDVDGLKKKIKEALPGNEVKPDNILRSQFDRINEKDSQINMLIGSKKFIEGWNSWRVSNMGLLNMGASEGPQIIQLFGRGVRLKGKNKSLKREDTQRYELKTLQTLSIFGVNANYIKAFLDNIDNELDIPEDVEIPIRFNRKDDWDNKIFTVKTSESFEFKKELVSLKYIQQIAQRITIDLRPKVTVTSGMTSALADSQADYHLETNPLINPFFSTLLDWEGLYLSLNTFRLARGYFNLVLDKEMLKEIIARNNYQLLLLRNQIDSTAFELKIKLNRYAEMVLKDYLNKFYADIEKKHLTNNLQARLLDSSMFPELFPEDQKLILKVPKKMVQEVIKLKEVVENFYKNDVKRVPTIHFDNHLYSPIASFSKGSDYEEIKSYPVKLNNGETEFIKNLRTYLLSKSTELVGKEVFVLRNLSRGKGIGFFVETASFYPDFIIWIKQEKQQDIIFIDPKGILMLGNVNDEKVRFCTHTINEIQDAVVHKLKEEGNEIILKLHAYILSVTPYVKVKPKFGNGNLSRADFKANQIIFQESNQSYLIELFEGKL
jgi:hypothetical protein